MGEDNENKPISNPAILSEHSALGMGSMLWFITFGVQIS